MKKIIDTQLGQACRGIRQWMLAACALWLLGLLPAQAASRTFSAAARSDFAYSVSRDTLYIANGNQILRYRVSTGQTLAPITDPNGSGSLRGIDLSIDERTLAITDNSFTFQPRVLLVDLDSDIATPFYFVAEPNEFATYGVAWGNDGRVLVSSAGYGYFDAPLRLLDPGSGSATIVGRIDNNATLRANSDRSLIAVENGLTPVGIGSLARYLVAGQALIYPQSPGYSYSSIDVAANRDGSQYALVTASDTKFFDSTLQQLPTTLGDINGNRPLSAAYDPGKDVVYTPWTGSRQVRAYDSASFAEVGRYTFDVRYPSYASDDATAHIRVSDDGQWLFANVEGGVVAVPTSDIDPESKPDPADLPTAEDVETSTAEDQPTVIALQGSDPTNPFFHYEIARQPANGSLQSFSNAVFYTPNADFFGTDSFTYLVSNEAGSSRVATVTIAVAPVNDAPTYTLNRQLYRVQLGGLRRADRDAVLDIRPGPANEAGQQVGFAVSNNNPALFIEQPRISQTGVLSYRPRLFGNGEAVVTVTGIDSGGTANGGVDRGQTMTFRIDVR